MKKIITFTIAIILLLTTIFFGIMNIRLNSKLNDVKEGMFTRLSVNNNFWNYSFTNVELYGIIYFDDLTKVEEIKVSYKDVMFNDVETYTSEFILDRETNTAMTMVRAADSTSFCVLDVCYIDGRTETLYIRIAMG